MAKLLPPKQIRTQELTTKVEAMRVITESYRKKIRNVHPKAVFDTEFALQGTIDQLADHLEAMFQPGMGWSNHGEWLVVTIKSARQFDLDTGDGFYKFFHYQNMMPQWKRPRGFTADPSKPLAIDRDGDSL